MVQPHIKLREAFGLGLLLGVVVTAIVCYSILKAPEDPITIRVCAQNILLDAQDGLLEAQYDIIELQNPGVTRNWLPSANQQLLADCAEKYDDDDYIDSLKYPK